MNSLQKITSIIDQSLELSGNVFNDFDKKLFQGKSEKIKEVLNENSFVKIPFVGDFSAGKSTLLNYLINNKTFLPTSITPTTAVSYELYYDTNQRLEIYNDGVVKEVTTLDKINSLEVESGYVVRVYIDNEVIKKYNDKNIVLVDMPGIDSGYNEHQTAIFNYISKGTSFVIVNDIESGTLKSSTINFIKEIEKYNLKSIILLSKSDKKSPTEVQKIKEHVKDISEKSFQNNVPVEVVSSVDNEIAPLIAFLDTVDSSELFETQNKPIVLSFLDEIIQKLEIQKNVLGSNNEEIEKNLKALEEEKHNVLNNLQETINNLPPVSESVNSLLSDISNELKLNTSTFATLLEKNATEEEFGNQIMSIVRPFLVEKSTKYANEIDLALGDLISTFENNVNSFFGANVAQNLGLQKFKNVGTQILGTGTKNLSKVFNPAMLQKAGAFLVRFKVPVAIAIGAIAVGLSLFWKNKKEDQKIDRREGLKKHFSDSIVGDIIGKLRNDVNTIFEQEKQQKEKDVIEYINKKVSEIEESIDNLKEQRDSQNNENKIINIDKVIEQLINLKKLF